MKSFSWSELHCGGLKTKLEIGRKERTDWLRSVMLRMSRHASGDSFVDRACEAGTGNEPIQSVARSQLSRMCSETDNSIPDWLSDSF
jgi:hypothetical protein